MTARPRIREHEVQAEITKALQLAGFEVLHTTAFRQRGPSGVAKGVPDLLVGHVAAPGSLLGIEVKRPGGRVRPEQRRLAEIGMTVVCNSVEKAVDAALRWLKRCPGATKGAVARAEAVRLGLEAPRG